MMLMMIRLMTPHFVICKCTIPRQVGAIGPGLDALLAPTMVKLLTELEKAEGPITLGPILGHVV